MDCNCHRRPGPPGGPERGSRTLPRARCLLPPGEFSAGMGQTRLLGLVALGLLLGASCQAHHETWCYDLPGCGPKTWPRKHCSGRRQSPVALWADRSVPASHFKVLEMSGYENPTLPIKVTNDGHSANVNLRPGAWLSGGGLSGNYTAQSFHLHWGKGLNFPGAEHLLEGTRASMELHVVHTKDGLPMNKAVKLKDGVVVLAFMTNVSDPSPSEASWNDFTSFLGLVPEKDNEQPVFGNFSLKGLLGAVKTLHYYFYQGSLTTPLCQEVVSWIVFREPILVSPDVPLLHHGLRGEANGQQLPPGAALRSTQGPAAVNPVDGEGGGKEPLRPPTPSLTSLPFPEIKAPGVQYK
ncbi:carbonic anhydrase 4-like isoform X1 [Ornithorhynchus anatinus]|uniref:carbonic anhydrase 4-like isoform X1 n=1 Tax=Ornithorhynchus anatinus TaxID=9258 RepID=UPI0019D4A88D|nr:carbonic anhydrase 4-like isoform X1 [Ornithorhynchus anatinus]